VSTYWYFECMDHDPPIQSDEFTQHTDDDSYRQGIRLALSRPLDPEYVNSDDYEGGYFESNTRSFLGQHPGCHLQVVNEYGEIRSFSDTPPPA
jgi:hypothetical protein